MLRTLRNPPPGLDAGARSRMEANILHLTKGLRYYSWDPNDYLEQIGSLKLPKENNLQVTEVPFAVQNKQKRWSPIMEYPEIKIKAPSLPGVYALEISLWDLHHNIGNTIRYEIEVR
jgi:hypothetical protein